MDTAPIGMPTSIFPRYESSSPTTLLTFIVRGEATHCVDTTCVQKKSTSTWSEPRVTTTVTALTIITIPTLAFKKISWIVPIQITIPTLPMSPNATPNSLSKPSTNPAPNPTPIPTPVPEPSTTTPPSSLENTNHQLVYISIPFGVLAFIIIGFYLNRLRKRRLSTPDSTPDPPPDYIPETQTRNVERASLPVNNAPWKGGHREYRGSAASAVPGIKPLRTQASIEAEKEEDDKVTAWLAMRT